MSPDRLHHPQGEMVVRPVELDGWDLVLHSLGLRLEPAHDLLVPLQMLHHLLVAGRLRGSI